VRSGQTISYQYDHLNRVSQKSGPTLTTVVYSYDLLGRQTQALFQGTAGKAISHVYDKAGRKTVENSYDWQLSYLYDEAGNVVRQTWPDGVFTTYGYDNASRLTTVTQSTGQQLASFTYDEIGRRTGLSRPNLINTSYGYDGASRLTSLTHTMTASGQPGDQEVMTFNPAGQVASLTHAAPFVWQNQPTVPVNETYDGLNRIGRLAAVSGYDANGDLINDGVTTYAYDAEGHMTGATGPVSTIEGYDPEGRMRARTTSVSAIVYMLLDGKGHIVAEYGANGLIASGGNPAAAPLRRYVFLPGGGDEPLVWYEGASPNWLLQDREGSVIGWANSSGSVTSSPGGTVNYGPYGEPSTWNMPRYAYTGQAAFSELQLYYYKARLYSPALGRFLQTDPKGYDAGDTNLYAYVGDDPIGRTDPTGLCPECFEAVEVVGEAASDVIDEALPKIEEVGEKIAESPAGQFVETRAEQAREFVGYRGSQLARNMAQAGRSVQKGVEQAHHIVARAAARAQPARDVLKRAGIGIDDAKNGAALKTGVHQAIHTKVNYDKINAALTAAEKNNTVHEALEKLREFLGGG